MSSYEKSNSKLNMSSGEYSTLELELTLKKILVPSSCFSLAPSLFWTDSFKAHEYIKWLVLPSSLLVHLETFQKFSTIGGFCSSETWEDRGERNGQITVNFHVAAPPEFLAHCLGSNMGCLQ